MKTSILEMPKARYDETLRYLLPMRSLHEEAAFVFGRANDTGVFTFVDVYQVPPSGFDHRSPYYLELSDETRQLVIKRAHDLNASVIEMHSHPMQDRAEFSPSDRRGFYEFVPHMLWRLKKRPYAAIVVTRTSFDSLAWFDNVDSPIPLAVRLDGSIFQPTALTHATWGKGLIEDDHSDE